MNDLTGREVSVSLGSQLLSLTARKKQASAQAGKVIDKPTPARTPAPAPKQKPDAPLKSDQLDLNSRQWWEGQCFEKEWKIATLVEKLEVAEARVRTLEREKIMPADTAETPNQNLYPLLHKELLAKLKGTYPEY